MEPNQSLSELAQALMQVAEMEANHLYHDFLGTEHVLLALTRAVDGHTARLLAYVSQDPHQFRGLLRARAWPGTARFHAGLPPRPSPRLRNALALAQASAGSEPIGERALLLGILRAGPGVGVRTLESLGYQVGDLIALVEADAGPEARQAGERAAPAAPAMPGPPPAARAPSATPLLDRYGRDLIAAARAGRLREILHRRREQAEVARALARVDRNVPVLVGEPGVGKTAIVEGLAARIAREHEKPVVASLSGKRIIELSLTGVVAGTSHRGEFEERLLGILQECRDHPEIILFLDEIHQIVGAGQASGSQDAAQILKPALARGELRVIGATTPAEYERFIARDAALERRMQVVRVEEPTPEEAKTLLRSIQPDLEKHYGVTLEIDALEAAIDLSVRYLPDRFLPDKALDLLDAAAAADAIPDEGVSLNVNGPVGEGRVTRTQIEAQIALRLGVPVGEIAATLQDRLLNLQRTLRRSVLGQEEALKTIEEALQVSMALDTRRERPRAVYLFAGPTGVGKTQTARAIAAALFPGDLRQTLLQIDMGEFSLEHALAQLIGSPPGYVGYEREGRLTGWLRRHPFSVILFDEIEKAHPATLDLLLGLFDTGRITDGQGRTVQGREALYLLTTNLLASDEEGKTVAMQPPSRTASTPLSRESRLRAELRKVLRPELVNRMDRVIRFQPLPQPTIRTIANRRLDALRLEIFGTRIAFDIGPEVLDWLASNGADASGGVRELDRLIDRTLKPELARLKLEAALPPNAIITIRIVNGAPLVAAQLPTT